MDLETENRIAAILMREAAELRRQAEKDGVEAYLQHPKVRGRPNSRFLTATVLGVQQANKAVEVNEMWRVRQKELDLDDRLRGKSRGGNSVSRSRGSFKPSEDFGHDIPSSSSPPSERVSEDCHLREDDGLKDEELEVFLHSRVKRGRGAVGSRMDETGPYLAPCNESTLIWPTSSNVTDRRVVYGAEKPNSLKSYSSSEEESDGNRRKRLKEVHTSCIARTTSLNTNPRGGGGKNQRKANTTNKSLHEHIGNFTTTLQGSMMKMIRILHESSNFFSEEGASHS